MAALFGFLISIRWTSGFLYPLGLTLLSFVIGSARHRQRLLLSFAIMCAMFSYGKVAYRLPDLPSEGIPGTAYFEASSIISSKTHFGSQWIYQGRAKLFVPDDPKATSAYGKNISCSIKLPQKRNIQRPPANQSYVIQGILRPMAKGGYYFTVKKDTPWFPVLNSSSCAEWRFTAKKAVKKYIFSKISDRQSREFLSGIVTGDFEDRIMRAELGKVGLQHIMAISGFHFAMIALMLSMLLRCILPTKMAMGVLIFLLSLYFFFVGGSPSITRAWVMSLVVFFGLIVEKPSCALNSLGVAILCILFYDPMQCYTLGFQFSTLTTASILLWYPVIKFWLEKILPKRHLGQMTQMHLLDQHCYFLLSVVKETFALAMAVNITALPLTLYYFHTFPYLSLVYNLFIPFLVSICMLVFLVACFVSVILPPIGAILHTFNSHYTHFMLNFVYNVPNTVNYSWRITGFSHTSLIFYLCSMYMLGIALKALLEEEHLTRQDLVLV